MAISIYRTSDSKLVVVSDALDDKPEVLIAEVAKQCKLRTVDKFLLAANPIFPEWRIALIAISPFLKPGVKPEQMQWSYPRGTKMRSANRNSEQVRGLL